MKRAAVAAVAFACALAWAGAGSAVAKGRETEPPVERILNPMPTFDPFDRPAPAPRFFPDEVDRRARAALIDGLSADSEALERHLAFFQQKDRELERERGTVSGLTGRVRALRRELEGDTSDDLVRAEALLRKSAVNRAAEIFNRLLSSIDLLGVVSGSYLGSAIDAATSQLFAIGEPTMSVEERKALALLHDHLRRRPDDPRAQALRKRVEALERQKRAVLVGRRLERARQAEKKGDLDGALFHFEVALLIDPESGAAKEGLEAARALKRQRALAAKGALSVTGEANAVASEDPEAAELLYALALGEPARIETRAKLIVAERSETSLGDSAKDALAVAAEIRGRHEQAKRILRELARSSEDPHHRGRAETILSSPEYNLRAALDDARRGQRLETVKFVLLGEDFLKKNMLYGTAPVLVGGPAGAASLAAANVLMMGTNLFEVLTANPVSPQPVIDRAAAYIRHHPDGQNSREVYSVLAEAYEEAGRYDRAHFYYELSGKADPKKLAELEEKAARGLLEAAAKSPDRTSREMYWMALLERYPESQAAKAARQRIAQRARMESQGLRLSKKFLLEHPELYGPRGLGLKTTLFDGDINNMELADRGVSLSSEREILLHFQTSWGVQSQSYPIAKEDSDRLEIALRRKRYEKPEKLQDLPLALFPASPPPIEGASEDGALALVREAGAFPPSFRRVLDHELLSDSEKRGGGGFTLPEIRGNIGPSGFDLSGALPAGLGADRIAVGADRTSPFAGVELPVPMLKGFIPVDFLFRAGPGRLSVFPKIHHSNDKGDNNELYR